MLRLNKVKKEFVSIRMSDVPSNQWLRIVLINPSEYTTITIPNRNTFVVYKAYFVSEYIKEKKMFNIVFPYKMFERALLTVPKEQRQDISRPIQFEFMKNNHSIFIRNWLVLR